MHGAPPVQLDCGRDARWHRLECLLAAAAAATAAGWAGAQLEWAAAPTIAAMLAAALAAAAAWWRLADRQPRAQLAWDGTRWRLDGREGTLAWPVDGGRWVLLRFRATGARRTVWLPLDLARGATPPALARAVLQATGVDHA